MDDIKRLLQIVDQKKQQGKGALKSDQKALVRDIIQSIVGLESKLFDELLGPKP